MQVIERRDCEMKRDMDLIRELLIGIEENPLLDGHKWVTPDKPEEIGISDRSIEEVGYHLHLLIEAGLVHGKPAAVGTYMPWISKLTWQGHEFLDDIRDQQIWAKTKERLKGLPSVALSLMAEIAKAEIKKRLGLP